MATELGTQLVEVVNDVSSSMFSWISVIVSVNYEIVSSVINILATVWSTLASIAVTIHSICSTVGNFLFEALTEVFNVVSLVVWTVQSVFIVIFKILSFAEYTFYPLEALVIYTCAGLRWIGLALYMTAASLLSGLFTSMKFLYFGAKLGFGHVFERVDNIGSSFIWVFVSAFNACINGVLYLYESVTEATINLITNVNQAILTGAEISSRFFKNTFMDITDSLTFEVYCGIAVIIVLYIATLYLRDFIADNGLTFPSVFQNNENVENEREEGNLGDNSDTESVGSEPSNFDGGDNDLSDFEDMDFVGMGTGHTLKKRPTTPARECDSSSSIRSEREWEHALETERDKRMCVICQENVKNVLLFPCKHLCACVDCANALLVSRQMHRRVCPLCRTRIRKVIDVYT